MSALLLSHVITVPLPHGSAVSALALVLDGSFAPALALIHECWRYTFLYCILQYTQSAFHLPWTACCKFWRKVFISKIIIDEEAYAILCFNGKSAFCFHRLSERKHTPFCFFFLRKDAFLFTLFPKMERIYVSLRRISQSSHLGRAVCAHKKSALDPEEWAPSALTRVRSSALAPAQKMGSCSWARTPLHLSHYY